MQLGLLHTLTYTSLLRVRACSERNFTTKAMIWIYPLWTFHLFVAAPPYWVYISVFIRYSRHGGSYEDFLDIWLLLTKKVMNHICMDSYWLSLSHTLKFLRLPPWLDWPLQNRLLINGFATRVTRRVPLEEQQLLTILEHLCSPSVLSEVCVPRSLVFWVVICRSLFVLFLLAIVFSVLWFTDTDYPLCNKSNTTGANREAGIAYPSRNLSSPPIFDWVCVAQSFVFFNL